MYVLSKSRTDFSVSFLPKIGFSLTLAAGGSVLCQFSTQYRQDFSVIDSEIVMDRIDGCGGASSLAGVIEDEFDEDEVTVDIPIKSGKL